MNSVLNNEQPMTYSISYERTAAADRMKKADFMSLVRPSVHRFCIDLARIIDATNPIQVPMVWSMYPERVWNPIGCPAVPCMKINPKYTDVTMLATLYGSGMHSPIEAILRARTTITIVCEPCWESYKRWGSAMIEDFYKAMRAVRAEYKIDKWDDNSETLVKWGEPKYIYSSPLNKPMRVETFLLDVPVVKHGEEYKEQQIEMGVSFYFQMPATPEKDKDSANCHVVEEEVTETVTKIVKKMKCY